MEKKLRLPAGVSATPGEVRLWPYQREIADAIFDPAIERVSLVKCVRVGFTTLLTGALAGYVANDPSPILALLPTEADCRDYVVSDIEPIFDASPDLRGLLTVEEDKSDKADKTERNTLLHRRFPGGSLKVVAAKSPRNLRRHNVRVLLIDEADGMEVSKEGSPLRLAERRTLSFPDRKIVLGSTPVFSATSHVLRAYAASDQRVFEVPCPDCGEFTEILWQHIVWEKDKPETAAFCCPHCGSLVSERHKPEMVSGGRWRVTEPGVHGHAGFRLNALVSLLSNASWAKLAKEFLEAKGTPEELQTFVNTILAQGWEEKGEAPEFQRLYDRRERWEPGTVPAGGLLLTAGIDTQRDRLEMSVWAWGRNRESWLIDHVVVPGSPFDWKTWEAMSVALDTQYRHEGGAMMRIDLAALDTGDGGTTSEAYAFVRKLGRNRVIPIKGQDKQPTAIAPGNKVEVKRNGARIGTVKLWHVGSSHLKGELYGQLRLERPTKESGEPFPPGYVHLPEHVASEEYCRQLTAEELRRTVLKNGFARREWAKTRERNEALDCRVYAKAAAALRGVDRWQDQRWLELETALDLEASKAPLEDAEAETPAPAVMDAPPTVPIGPAIGQPNRQTTGPRQRFAPAW